MYVGFQMKNIRIMLFIYILQFIMFRLDGKTEDDKSLPHYIADTRIFYNIPTNQR